MILLLLEPFFWLYILHFQPLQLHDAGGHLHYWLGKVVGLDGNSRKTDSWLVFVLQPLCLIVRLRVDHCVGFCGLYFTSSVVIR